MMTGLDDIAPSFASGLCEEDGRVTGCWVVDMGSLLTPRPQHHAREATAWSVRRLPGSPSVRLLQVRPDLAREHASAVTCGHRQEGAASSSTMRDFVRWVRRLEAMVADVTGAVRPPPAVPAHPGTAPPGGSREERALRVARAGEAARAAIEPFLRTLDPVALDLAGDAGEPHVRVEAYGWLDRTFAPEAPLAAAWRAKPWMRETLTEILLAGPEAFARAVAAGPGALDDLCRAHFATRVARRTDGWDGLYDVLEDIGPVIVDVPEGPKSALRWSSRLMGNVEEIGVRAARLACRLPRSWVPRATAEWTAFLACVPAVEMAVGGASLGEAGAMLNARGDWGGLGRRLAAATGTEGLNGGLVRSVADVADMVRAYSNQVVVPAVALAGLPPLGHCAVTRSRNLILSGRTVCRILDSSRRWHAHAAAIAAALPSAGTTDSWPAALPDLRRGAVTVTVLATRGDLIDEGTSGPDRHGVRGLSHCVGGYAGTCLRGERRVLSIRHVDGCGSVTRLSTVEVAVECGRVRVHQHRGLRNSEPGQAAVDALAGYLSAFADGRLRCPAWLPVTRTGSDPASDHAGYDVRDPGAWEAVRDLWAPLVPGPLRGLGPRDLASLASLPGLDASDHGWRRVPYGPADLADHGRPIRP